MSPLLGGGPDDRLANGLRIARTSVPGRCWLQQVTPEIPQFRCKSFLTLMVRSFECTDVCVADAATRKKGADWAHPVNLRTITWGVALATAGIYLLAAGPGTPSMASGPRIGLGMFLAMIGGLMLIIPVSRWFIFRRAVPADYEGRCPIGESCGDCGAFNYKPRQLCRSCSHPVNRPDLS